MDKLPCKLSIYIYLLYILNENLIGTIKYTPILKNYPCQQKSSFSLKRQICNFFLHLCYKYIFQNYILYMNYFRGSRKRNDPIKL